MNSRSRPKVEEMLRGSTLRRTRGRVAVLKVLSKAKKPLTREQIAGRLGKGTLDKVTIYRTLERFVEAGLVHRAYLHKRASYYELAHNCTESQCHPHFTCMDCGDTHCLTEVRLPMARNLHTGFVVDRQRVQLEGLCPKCNPDAA